MKSLLKLGMMLILISISVSALMAGELNQIKNGEQSLINPVKETNQIGGENQSLIASMIDRTITYQGILKTNTGSPVPNNTYNLTFRIYKQSSGGSAIWTSASTPVVTISGYFGAQLGPISLPFDTTYYISIEVAGDAEMSRQMMTMSPYSASADTANYARTGGSYWTLANNVIYTNGSWGIAKGNVGNILYGDSTKFMVNLGVACTTGISGQNRLYTTIGGGYYNAATGHISTVAGGQHNSASGLNSTVSGGGHNKASGESSVVSGGDSNIASNLRDVVAGGAANTANGWRSVVSGGSYNLASGPSSVVAGGEFNTAMSLYAVVSGGTYDTASGRYAVVSGGRNNTSRGEFSAVLSGGYNNVTDTAAIVAGGLNNFAGAKYAVVGGGQYDTVTWAWATVCGGFHNKASGEKSFVGGGGLNVASGWGSTIGGGYGNYVNNDEGTVAGGLYDTAGGQWAAVAGGNNNVASGQASSISGGQNNRATNEFSAVGGGQSDSALGICSFVGGGKANTARGVYAGISSGCFNQAGDAAVDTGAFIGGGYNNLSNARFSVTSGGRLNNNSGRLSTIAGGQQNYISGEYSAIMGGEQNYVSGSYSVIVGGRRDTVPGYRSLVFGENVYLNGDYRVALYDGLNWGLLGINRDDHDGGISYPIHVGTSTSNGNGAYLTTGGVWTNGSSRTFKENFMPFDSAELLRKISALSVTTYNYKGTNEKHVGPVAEEFTDAFDTGVIRESDGKREDMYLAASDVAGVALAGVQELLKIVSELKHENEILKSEIASLKNQARR